MSGETLGVKLAKLRKIQGKTQEDLAIETGLTSRTIQRIEKDQVNPQPHTVKLLARALNCDPAEFFQLNPEKPEPQPESQPRNSRIILLHLFPLFVLAVPFANFLAPAFYWLWIRDEHPDYDKHGRKVLNFQASLTIACGLSIVLLVLFFPVGFPLLLLCYAFGLIQMVLNVRRAARNLPVHYPMSTRFIPVRETGQTPSAQIVDLEMD